MKRVSILIIVTIAMLICLGFNASKAFILVENQNQPAYTSDNLLRLHILANSSSPQDQYLKRQVRDLILKETNKFFDDIPTLERAVEVTDTKLPTLQQKVREYLKTQGKDYNVKMEIGDFHFPTRTYGDITLPAGEYQALQVVLGEGDGNNWWCVLFPPLCLDNEKEKKVKNEETLLAIKALSKEKDIEVEYRFKFLESFKVFDSVPQWVNTNYEELLKLAIMGSNGPVN